MQLLRIADAVPLLRQRDDVRAERRRPCHQPFGAPDVRRLVGGRRQLYARDADPIRHRANDSFGPVDAAAPRRLKVFDAFRHRDFRLLWTGQVISAIGDAAFFTALAWRAFTLAGSQKTGIVFVCQGVGLLTTLLIGGALADRLPRCMMIAGLAGIDAAGHLSFPVLAGLALLAGLGDGFFFPAFGGIVPLVVEADALPSANSLIGVSRWGSILVGPSLAALLYGAF